MKMNNPPSPPFSKEGQGRFEQWLVGSIETPIAKGCLFILFSTLIYHPVMLELFHAWQRNHYYNQGFLIPLISGYLVYRNRERLRAIQCKSTLYGIIFLLAGIFIFFMDKYFFNVLFLSSIGMLVFIMGGILFLFGKDHLRAVLFPLSFPSFYDSDS